MGRISGKALHSSQRFSVPLPKLLSAVKITSSIHTAKGSSTARASALTVYISDTLPCLYYAFHNTSFLFCGQTSLGACQSPSAVTFPLLWL